MGVNVSKKRVTPSFDCSDDEKQCEDEIKGMSLSKSMESKNYNVKRMSGTLGNNLKGNDRQILLRCWHVLGKEEKNLFIEDGFVSILLKSKLIRQTFGVAKIEDAQKLKQNQSVKEHILKFEHFLTQLLDLLEKGNDSDFKISTLCKKTGSKHAKVNKLAWGITSFQLFVWGISRAIVSSLEKKGVDIDLIKVDEAWEKLMQSIAIQMRSSLYKCETRHGGLLLPAMHRPSKDLSASLVI